MIATITDDRGTILSRIRLSDAFKVREVEDAITPLAELRDDGLPDYLTADAVRHPTTRTKERT